MSASGNDETGVDPTLEAKLRIIWDKAEAIGVDPRGQPRSDRDRYIPLAIDGGPAWDVFDKKFGRYVHPYDLLHIDDEDLREERLTTVN